MQETAAGRVLAWIEARINADGLGVGDGLPREQEMADAVGVGRSSVREALTTLKVLGIIEQRRKGGIRIVRDPVLLGLRHYFAHEFHNDERHRDVLEFRAALEWGFGPLTAARMDADGLRALRDILDGVAAADPASVDLFSAEIRFHTLLVQAAGNPLAGLFAHLYGPLFRAQAATSRFAGDPAYVPVWVEQHGKLVDALEAGDSEGFLEQLRRHTLQYMRWPDGTNGENA